MLTQTLNSLLRGNCIGESGAWLDKEHVSLMALSCSGLFCSLLPATTTLPGWAEIKNEINLFSHNIFLLGVNDKQQ